MTEQEFLKSYNPDAYEKPSVTADILIFTINNARKLELLLIKRGGHPYKGKWALPGGFVNMKESLDEAAARELKEETGLDDIYLEQLYTFGSVNRDPRMRVISVAYIALVPKDSIHAIAGDDAAEVAMFEISEQNGILTLHSSETGDVLSAEDLAFDHADVILTGIKRLKGKLSYTDIAFELLADKYSFTLFELKNIYEAILGEELDYPNFRRQIQSKYIQTGILKKLEETKRNAIRPSACYAYMENGRI